MALTEDLGRIAAAAAVFATPGETLAGVLPTEPSGGERIYLCAFGDDGSRSWLALDGDGTPIGTRDTVRAAVSIAALCELAEETAAGGDLDELRAQLVALRVTDDPPGLDEAEEAVAELQRTIGQVPRLATPGHLDAVGSAVRRLERSLDETQASPFAEAMKSGMHAVETLTVEVERGYKLELS